MIRFSIIAIVVGCILAVSGCACYVVMPAGHVTITQDQRAKGGPWSMGWGINNGTSTANTAPAAVKESAK